MTAGAEKSALQRCALSTVILLIVSIPAGNTAIGPLQLIQVMAILAVMAVLTTAAIRLRLPLPPWLVGLPLSAMVVAAALATLGTPVPDVSFRINGAMAVGVLLVVAMWVVVDRPAYLMTLVRSLALAGATVSVIALTSTGDLSTAAGGAIVVGRVVGIFAQPNELGVFAAMLLPAAVALALTRSGVQRLLASAAAMVIAGALVLSLSRGAWFGAAIGILALMLQLPDRRRTASVLVAGFVSLGAGALLFAPSSLVAVVDQRIASVTSQRAENPYDEREEIYAEAGRQISDSPLFGHGPGAFTRTAHRITQDGYDLNVDHAHSLILVVATEYGMLGTLAFLALCSGLVTLLYQSCWRRRSTVSGTFREVTIVVAGLFAGLTALVAHGVVDYPLRNPVTGMTAWIILGLTVAGIRCARLAQPGPPATTKEDRS